MMDLPKDTVIYNEEETKRIMDNKVDISGNAHANGTVNNPVPPNSPVLTNMYPEMPLWERMEKCAAALGRTMEDMLNPLNSLALDVKKETGMGRLLESVNNVNNVTNNNKNVQPVVNQNVTINCPNVTNESGAENIQKELSTLSLKALQVNW